MARCMALVVKGRKDRQTFSQCKHDGGTVRVWWPDFFAEGGKTHDTVDLCYLHHLACHKRGKLPVVTGHEGMDPFDTGTNLVGHTVHLEPLERS